MSALEFWNAGHKISGFDAYYGSAFVGMRKFRQLFGTTPMICAIIWQLLDVKGCLPLRTKPLHMLCALLFLKVYGTEEVHSAMTGLTEKTFRKWSTIYIELIAQELDVIQFENRFEGATPGETCFMSLDATDCRISEPSPFDRMWYSHKLNGPGLKYEIALNIVTGDMVWVFGGLPCGTYASDLSLARKEFVGELYVGEKVLADKGYQDMNHFINSRIYPATAGLQKQILARHETVNGRLKKFNLLNSPFRHTLEFHSVCFYAIANIVQMAIENGEPLFKL